MPYRDFNFWSQFPDADALSESPRWLISMKMKVTLKKAPNPSEMEDHAVALLILIYQ